MKTEAHLFCHNCGTAYDTLTWPRRCATCTNMTYQNPTPVAVLLQPVDEGILVVKRGIDPGMGLWALPGGFMDLGESWEKTAVRELYEETNIQIPISSVTLLSVQTFETGIAIFGIGQPLSSQSLPPFIPNFESIERGTITEPTELAFDLHTQIVTNYFTL